MVGIKIDASTDLEGPARTKVMSIYSTMNLDFDIANLVTFKKRMHGLKMQKYSFKATWISICISLRDLENSSFTPTNALECLLLAIK